MLIKDIRSEFYDKIIGQRVLLVVNYDIDAICALKILQSMFMHDHIMYSIVPIMGLSGLKRAFEEHKDIINTIILINCGGCVDLVEILEPEENNVFYIFDSHRPLDVCNIYSDGQISVYAKQSDNETVPAFASIFRDSDTEESGDESEADSGDEESENRAEDRVRRFERRLEKRRERQRWKDDRNKILFDYTQFSFYGQSSAQIFFELAWKMSKDSLDILWWSLVGITEQFVLGKIAKAAYAIQATEMQSHVSRLMSRTTQGNSSQTSIQILFENDLQFALYRHWSIQESLKHSIIPSCKLRLWTVWGEKRLHELLVEMGLPLVQSRQVFTSMDLELKKEFLEMIEKCAEKYDLMEVIYSSFTLQYGYRNKYSAADYVYSMLAILESVKRNRSPEYCFLEALDSLTRTNRELLESGIEWSKKLLQATYRQVTTSLDTHQILTAGPYLYVILNEEESYFSCPHGLLMLAKFILKAHVSISRNRRAPEMPLVACSPIDITEGIYLLIGIPPVCEFSLKSFFGKAFEQAAIKSKATVVADSFDPTVIQIKQSDLVRFLDALTVLLS